MLEDALSYQKRLHIERLDKLIEKVVKLPKGTFPEDNDVWQIAGYLAGVKEQMQLAIKVKEDA